MTDAGERRRVVFVAGLTHSGSTILGLALGTARSAIVLGEVVPLLLPGARTLWEDDRVCSCGRRLERCEMWAIVRRRLERTSDASSLVARYRTVVEAFGETFGSDAVLVDTSKSVRALDAVREVDSIDLRVVHLVRDVRSWMVSRESADRRKGRERWRDLVGIHGPRGLGRRLLRLAPLRPFAWYRGNRALEARADGRHSSCRIGYEEFALMPDRAAGHLGRELDLEIPRPVDPSTSTHHIALGNRMRLDPVRTARIAYDFRWFHERGSWVTILAMPWIRGYNERMVYGNVESFHAPSRR